MNLNQICQVELAVRLLDARLGPVLEPELRECLQTLRFWALEIRHFAACWDDLKQAEAEGRLAPDKVASDRKEVEQRLLFNFRPE